MIPENTSFAWNARLCTHTSQRILVWEVLDLALACGSESVFDAVCAAVVGSARIGRVLDAGSAREDGSSDIRYTGDTRQPFSEKDVDSILHTRDVCRTTREAPGCSTSCHIATHLFKK